MEDGKKGGFEQGVKTTQKFTREARDRGEDVGWIEVEGGIDARGIAGQ